MKQHLEQKLRFLDKILLGEMLLDNIYIYKKYLTVNDQREVAIIKGRVWDRNSSLVEAVVDPLAGSWRHVQDPFGGIIWAAADQVPVHHPLTVLQPVAGPHHARAVTWQYGRTSRREGEVLGLHDHTKPAATALTPC